MSCNLYALGECLKSTEHCHVIFATYKMLWASYSAPALSFLICKIWID